MTTKFYMSDDEIRRDYQRAKDKKNQMKILADMNLCKVEQMRQKLEELGVIELEDTKKAADGKETPEKKGKKKADVAAVKQMSAATLGDLMSKLAKLCEGAAVTVSGMEIGGVLVKMRFDGTNSDTPTDMSVELEVRT